jgi:hypothetical protein
MSEDGKLIDYVRQEAWVDKVEFGIDTWEQVQGVEVPDEVRQAIVKFMRGKIKRGIEKGNLTRMFLQIAVTSLIYIKMRGKK